MDAAHQLPEADVIRHLGGTESSTLLGFVIEESAINSIRFETWREDRCREGLLVWCRVDDKKVFYQITDGVTKEETLQADRHGFQYALAAQLGVFGGENGFEKYPWLPAMNTPIFCEDERFGADAALVRDGDFVYGCIPGTDIRVGGPFFEAFDHHTAILGVTGSGKTELAFDLIRHVLSKNAKVVCIDLTARYENRLKDLNHTNLSISSDLSKLLGEKLFDAETGAFGAGQEKKALKLFADQLKKEVSERIKSFLVSADDRLGIISLDEISNTKATLFITELYLTCLLRFARDNPTECPQTLIVVEEAHTVMPEPSTMGLGDFDSKGLVSKISQIALQGRKYGIGLLVIAQRTATVSKSVLTQCNTTIAFNCFDETSLGFLSNVFGDAHAHLIPNLPRRTAIVFGKGVRSERPIVVEIPYDAKKVGA
jgi:DNA helicase HerA-like ATPase